MGGERGRSELGEKMKGLKVRLEKRREGNRKVGGLRGGSKGVKGGRKVVNEGS